MFAWLGANIGWLLILAALAAVVTAVIVSLARDRKRGKHICGGDCAHCRGCK